MEASVQPPHYQFPSADCTMKRRFQFRLRMLCWIVALAVALFAALMIKFVVDSGMYPRSMPITYSHAESGRPI